MHIWGIIKRYTFGDNAIKPRFIAVSAQIFYTEQSLYAGISASPRSQLDIFCFGGIVSAPRGITFPVFARP